ncbi:MAG: response regulator [Candidatus Curtissbacteria bacterium]
MANIMLVEDDINLSSIYKQKLTEGGHIVTVVPDSEAVKQILATKPNLVLLDILMPNVSGLDILREVKADPNGSSIPIILLTNVAEDISIAKGLQFGAYGYLLKSETTPDQVLTRVNMSLEETVPATP